MAPCPRCSKENPPTAAACARCGLPLALGQDPAPARLDRELDLDRRSRRPTRSVPGGQPEPGPQPPFDPDRSDWRLAAPAAEPEPEEPEPHPPAPAASGPAAEPGPTHRSPRLPGAAPQLPPAPPCRRALAWAVDGALVAVAAVALPAGLLGSTGAFRAAGSAGAAIREGLPIVVPSLGFVAVAALTYATVAHALAGATLGKRLAGIRVVGADGRPPDPATSAKRSAWALLSFALAGAGLLPALLGPSRRALHDHLAGTRVVVAP